jgi:hypothetical protein
MQTGQSGFYLNEIVEFDNGAKQWLSGFKIIEFHGMTVRLAAPPASVVASPHFSTDWWPLGRIRKTGFARTRLI